MVDNVSYATMRSRYRQLIVANLTCIVMMFLAAVVAGIIAESTEQ